MNLFKTITILIILCSVTFAEQLQPVQYSNLKKLAPTTSVNHPSDNFPAGFEIGRVGAAESELVAEWLLTPYIGYLGGVKVFSASWGTAWIERPFSQFLIKETPLPVSINSSWNNFPGPAPTIGNTLLAINGQSGTGQVPVSVTSSALAFSIQQSIDNGFATYSLVHYAGSTGSNLARTFLPVVVVEAYLGGDADKDGDVDFTDFLILNANYDELGDWEQGDFNGNGIVDFPDFLRLSANFGETLE